MTYRKQARSQHQRPPTPKNTNTFICSLKPSAVSVMADLLRLLLRVAEKAANVARVCRQEALLFQLLVQEKTGEDKNKKFVQDFKTLADVVIQEMIRHDVGTQFDEMIGFIHGEESNKFENGLGESVTVTVCATEEETAALLATVLDGDHVAASLLARAIHQDPVAVTDISIETLNIPLSPTDLAIWIDPIDATSQYIEGREEVLLEGHLSPSGLQCALVLIGVYLRTTGEPVMGVINQPFHHKDSTGGWKGQHFWGVSYGSFKACSVDRPKDRTEDSTGGGGISVVLSSSEKQAVKEALTPLCGQGRPMYASGAGYKILCVIQGLADIYVLSEGSTFKWDSCAPHALLRALGGGMVDLAECIRSSSGERAHQEELTYHRPNTESHGADRWANQGGLVAYLDSKLLPTVIRELKGKF